VSQDTHSAESEKEGVKVHIKKAVAVLGASALTLGLAACGSDSADNAADGGNGGDNYILVNGSEPQRPLLPGDTNETGGGRITDVLYAGLTYYDKDGESHNELAESIEPEGEKSYRVTLKDTKWADGTPVTANDFVDAWNYAVENSQMNSSFFEPIKGYEDGKPLEGLQVVDDKTFTIELEQPEADFPQRLGYVAYAPLHPSAFDDMEAYGENPIANGPYKLLEWNHNQDAIVVPNEEYQGDRKAQNDGVNFVFYAQQDAAYADLLSGNLDVLDAVPDSAMSNFEEELGERAVNQPAAAFQSVTLNENEEHFGGEEGKLRRQAISKAIDRDEITQTIFEGTRTPATDFASPVIPGHSDDLEGVEVHRSDPEEAKHLWEAADKINKFDGELEISYNADGGHQAWVDAVANSIRNAIGIEAVGNAYPDFKSLLDDMDNDAVKGAFRTGWSADYPSLGNFLIPLYSTNGSSNYARYSNPAVDTLLSDAASAESPEAAAEKYNEVQRVLFEDLPAIPLWNQNVTGGYSENVENVEFSWRSLPVLHQITKN